MKYGVKISEQAQTDLHNIFAYIAINLQAEQTAINQLNRLEQAIKDLDYMPARFRVYEKEPWHSRGMRIMPINNYLVFYIVDKTKKQVSIIRIFHGMQNYEDLL